MDSAASETGAAVLAAGVAPAFDPGAVELVPVDVDPCDPCDPGAGAVEEAGGAADGLLEDELGITDCPAVQAETSAKAAPTAAMARVRERVDLIGIPFDGTVGQSLADEDRATCPDREADPRAAAGTTAADPPVADPADPAVDSRCIR